jgi:hypothetical protein
LAFLVGDHEETEAVGEKTKSRFVQRLYAFVYQ